MPVVCTLTNTGDAAAGVEAHFRSDVFRLAASVDGRGWSAHLPNALAAIEAGASRPVTIDVAREGDAVRSATLTLRATSESDPARTATVVIRLSK
jgi:hypothetical protein